MNSPASSPRKISFKAALLGLLLGTLLLTVGCIALAGYLASRRSIEAVKRQHYGLISLAVSREIQEFFKPAYRSLLEFQTLGGRGLLPLDDPGRLGALFAERMRYLPSLSWMSYSDLGTGRFVGVRRQAGGGIVLNQSLPAENAGRPREALIEADGTATPLETDLPAGYDPRPKPWFQGALRSPGVFWSEIYTFAEGERGISASVKCLSAATGEPIGVFTTDFSLSDITAFLDRIDPGRRRLIAAMTQTGDIFGFSSNPPVPANTVARLARAIPAAQREAMREGQSSFRAPLDFAGEEGEVVFTSSEVDGTFRLITGIGSPDVEFLGPLRENARLTLAIGVGALALAALASAVFARRLARTLAQINLELEEVGRFRLGAMPWAPSAVRELDHVHQAVDRMKAGLRSFGRYVPRQLVRSLLSEGIEARLGGEVRELTVFFSDIAGFTALSERMPPTALVERLGEYLEMISARLASEGGTIDKFMGDGVLAFFNAPHAVADHAARACRTACSVQHALAADEAAAARAPSAPAPLRTRIGLHTGEVLVGNIGTRERFAYTIIGDAVNLTSRLESLNKLYGTRILASEGTWSAARHLFEWRRLDRVAVYGRAGGTLVVELLGERGGVPDAVLAARDAYERGLDSYLAGKFAAAGRAFDKAAELRPDDLAARLLERRASYLAEQPPTGPWDGVFVAEHK